MTCAFCKFEFCWVCGESATNKENHFGLTRGCGTEMMDESAKPGDHLGRLISDNRKRIAWKVLKIILYILFLPVIAVFIGPY